jgi:hypothetical protein
MIVVFLIYKIFFSFLNLNYGMNDIYNAEATSLECKHVEFRKPWCSATGKLGVDCVRNICQNSLVPTIDISYLD